MAHLCAHILIIDDEASVRITLGALLQRKGHVVTLAASGDEAVRHLEQHTFDLLILDLLMPGMNGNDVARQANALQPATPIIILTGQGSLDRPLDGGLPGTCDYILKTSAPHAVLERVEAVLIQRASAYQGGADQSPPYLLSSQPWQR